RNRIDRGLAWGESKALADHNPGARTALNATPPSAGPRETVATMSAPWGDARMKVYRHRSCALCRAMFPPYSKPPGFLIAAPRSGSGKTAVTLGLLRALKRRGLIVQPFKCGPDYIDPAFHEAACGRPSYNLDSWTMRTETVYSLLDEAMGADITLIEA